MCFGRGCGGWFKEVREGGHVLLCYFICESVLSHVMFHLLWPRMPSASSFRKRAATSKPKAKTKIKKKKREPFNLHGPRNKLLKKGLEKDYEGKHVLLKASQLYKGKHNVPDGEERYLFQYHIYQVNDDLESATIEFDECYVDEGSHSSSTTPSLNANTNTTHPS